MCFAHLPVTMENKNMDSSPSILFLLSLGYGLIPYCSSQCCSCSERDCDDVKALGHTTSGVYHVTPERTNRGIDVYCDMETEGGGWLVVQRRLDGSEDFYRDWTDYERGFGNVSQDHWLGLVPLKRILAQGVYELRFDLQDWANEKRYASYNIFSIGESEELYKLKVRHYTGDAGNAMENNDGMKFSTLDDDNDRKDSSSCAKLLKGGWWYYGCGYVNVNGIYYTDNGTEHSDGIFWKSWLRNGKESTYSLKKVEMKIRKV